MINDIFTSIRLKIAYKTNSFIYSFKTIPLIGKIIPDEFYAIEPLKKVFAIIFIIFKLLISYPIVYGGYVFLIYLLSGFTNTSFLFVFLVFSLLLSIIKPNSIKANRDSDYAVNGLHMSAKKYLITNYIYQTTITFCVLLLNLLIVCLLLELPIYFALILSLMHIGLKSITSNINIHCVHKRGIRIIYYIFIILLDGLLIYSFFKMKEFSDILLIIYTCFAIVFGIWSFLSILKFNKYRIVFKKLFAKQLSKKSLKEIEIDKINDIIEGKDITSDKHGYDLLHDLFVKRHAKILRKAARENTIILLIALVIIIAITIFIPHFRPYINKYIHKYCLYFLAIMYFFIQGEKICQAMFMNCDHAMLTFRIYRSPKVILAMFKRRLRTMISLNLLPSLIFGFGLMILLIITKEAHIYNIIFLPIAILFIGVFCSIHHLVFYYLLQPFNANTEQVSKSYGIAKTVSYVVCVYPALYIEDGISITLFCILSIIIAVLYTVISLYIVQHYAYKTFKIKY